MALSRDFNASKPEASDDFPMVNSKTASLLTTKFNFPGFASAAVEIKVYIGSCNSICFFQATKVLGFAYSTGVQYLKIFSSEKTLMMSSIPTPEGSPWVIPITGLKLSIDLLSKKLQS